jgi:hypothetical protein
LGWSWISLASFTKQSMQSVILVSTIVLLKLFDALS